jgi:hypothetical protein
VCNICVCLCSKKKKEMQDYMRPAPRYDGERPYIYTYVKHFSKKRTRDVQIQKKASISYPDDLEFWIYCYTSIMDRGEVYGTPYVHKGCQTSVHMLGPAVLSKSNKVHVTTRAMDCRRMSQPPWSQHGHI